MWVHIIYLFHVFIYRIWWSVNIGVWYIWLVHCIWWGQKSSASIHNHKRIKESFIYNIVQCLFPMCSRKTFTNKVWLLRGTGTVWVILPWIIHNIFICYGFLVLEGTTSHFNHIIEMSYAALISAPSAWVIFGTFIP